MKKLILSIFLCCGLTTNIMAQNENDPFKGYYYNDEYNIYLKIDLHSDGLIVPEHEMFGKLPGYLGKKNNSFYWLITTKDIKNKKKAIVEFINDYGSEDLEASFKKRRRHYYSQATEWQRPESAKQRKMAKDSQRDNPQEKIIISPLPYHYHIFTLKKKERKIERLIR